MGGGVFKCHGNAGFASAPSHTGVQNVFYHYLSISYIIVPLPKSPACCFQLHLQNKGEEYSKKKANPPKQRDKGQQLDAAGPTHEM